MRYVWSMQDYTGNGFDGYAVGGLAVGESHEEMYHIPDVTVPACLRTSLYI